MFEYDVDENFNTIDNPLANPPHPLTYTSGELTTLSIKPTTMSLGTYNWHVKALDTAGNWSDWSVARVVKVVPLAPAVKPILVGPVNGKIVTDANPLQTSVTVSWKAITGAVTYRIQMDNNSTFSSREFDETTSSPSELNILATLGPGTYYWRVSQNDKYGGASAWSAVWRFSIDVVVPLGATQVIE
jgi:hypothetical protein